MKSKIQIVGCNAEECGVCWACKQKKCYECDRNFCKHFKNNRPCKIMTPDEYKQQILMQETSKASLELF